MAKKDTTELKMYELALIIKATIPDTEKKDTLKKIKDIIEKAGGRVEEEHIWGKRVLAFPIQKQQEGYYVINNILLGADKVNDFKNLLNINTDLIRYLLRKVDAFEGISVSTETSQRENNR